MTTQEEVDAYIEELKVQRDLLGARAARYAADAAKLAKQNDALKQEVTQHINRIAQLEGEPVRSD